MVLFLMGFIVGGALGVLVAALMAAAGQADRGDGWG